MKCYNKLRNLKKSTKIGLATSAVYAATALALPAFAAVKEEPKPVPVETISLDKITTIEQADTLYKAKIKEYANDNLLTLSELGKLSKIQSVKLDILKKENHVLISEYEKKIKPVKKLDKDIGTLEKELYRFRYSYGNSSPFNKIEEKLKNTILNYYPALMNQNKGNVTYSAEAKLKPTLVVPFKNLIIEADKLLKEYYEENSLELLINETEYALNDVLTLYHTIIQRRGDETYKQKIKKELEDQIAQLKKEKEILSNSEQMLSLTSKIESFNRILEENSSFINTFKKYSSLKKTVEDFESNYGSFNNQFFISIVKQVSLEKEGLRSNKLNALGGYAKRFENIKKTSISKFEESAKNEGLEVKIEKLKNPAKTIVPWWLGLVLGGTIPIIRNLIVKSYVKGSDADPGEYVMSGIAGLFNGVLGVVILDGLHPLVLPIRMITPCFFQPIFKLLKTDPAKEFSDLMRDTY